MGRTYLGEGEDRGHDDKDVGNNVASDHVSAASKFFGLFWSFRLCPSLILGRTYFWEGEDPDHNNKDLGNSIASDYISAASKSFGPF